MSLAKKCDRCENLYESYPAGHKSRYNALQLIYRNSTGGVVNGSTVYDLCPECMEKFLTFIAKGENK